MKERDELKFVFLFCQTGFNKRKIQTCVLDPIFEKFRLNTEIQQPQFCEVLLIDGGFMTCYQGEGKRGGGKDVLHVRPSEAPGGPSF